MIKKNVWLKNSIGLLVILLTVIVVSLTAIRLLMTSLFPIIEYRMPGFPEDRFGFSQEDRLALAPLAMDYLFNNEPAEWLNATDAVVFEDGDPLYNERELSHMHDVKVLIEMSLNFWVFCLTLFVVIMLWAWRTNWLEEWKIMVSWGGLITIGFMVVLGVGIGFGFDALFTQFHHLFFEGDTWLFYTSDTLIRLFPMRFWRDGFAAGAILILIGSLAAWQLPKFGKK